MFGFLGAIAISCAVLHAVMGRSPHRLERLRESIVRSPIKLGLLILTPPLVALLLASVQPSDQVELLMVILGLGAIAAFFAAWVREFVGLMGLGDDAFPGRHDKALWFALMVILPPVGLVSFITFRKAYWASAKPEVDPIAREMV